MEPVVVRVRDGDCPCPGTPHEYEEVTLEPKLTVPMGYGIVLALRQVIQAKKAEGVVADNLTLQSVITENAIFLGIVGWTFIGENGTAVPRTRETIAELLPFHKGGLEIADQAEDLYEADLTGPLVRLTEKFLAVGQTEPAMSAISGSGVKLPKHSKRSSQNGTAGRPSEAPVP